MDRETFRVGLIGLGMIGKIHARVYRQLQLINSFDYPKIELIIFVRPDHRVENEFLDEIGSPTIRIANESLSFEKLDLVDICTPNAAHLSYTDQACQIGAHVYCEKPIARNLVEARRMVEVTEKAGVLTHIAFIFRYFPAIQKLIASIVAGDIGKPLHFRLAIMNGGYLNSERPLSWRLQKSEAGGGVLADLGIHLIDILRASLGEIAWIQCDSRTHITERPISPKSLQKTNVDVDDWAVCTLGLEQGGVGIIEVSRVAAGREQSTSIEIYGEKGSLAVDFIKPQEARIFQTKVGVWKLVENNKVGNEYQLAQRFFRNATSLMDYGFAAHFASVEDFLLSIKQKQSNPIDFCSALKNQKVLEAAYKSSTTDGMRIYLKH